jgi:ABC-type spermidine/putrescine transport system permease subunit I
MAWRGAGAIRPILLMLVILPFWTSFLIRVYAWIGILKPEGLLNQLLLATGIIEQPLVMLNTHTAIFIGIVYSYLPFMVLPLYSTLEKMDYSLMEAAQDLGCPPMAAFWKITFPLSLPGVDRRLPARLHPGRRRVRHPRPARRLRDADDRQGAVERVLRQPRLAGWPRRWR